MDKTLKVLTLYYKILEICDEMLQLDSSCDIKSIISENMKMYTLNTSGLNNDRYTFHIKKRTS